MVLIAASEVTGENGGGFWGDAGEDEVVLRFFEAEVASGGEAGVGDNEFLDGGDCFEAVW